MNRKFASHGWIAVVIPKKASAEVGIDVGLQFIVKERIIETRINRFQLIGFEVERLHVRGACRIFFKKKFQEFFFDRGTSGYCATCIDKMTSAGAGKSGFIYEYHLASEPQKGKRKFVHGDDELREHVARQISMTQSAHSIKEWLDNLRVVVPNSADTRVLARHLVEALFSGVVALFSDPPPQSAQCDQGDDVE